MITLIAAVASNGVIGNSKLNEMPWHCSDELKFFKENNKWKDGCPFYLEDPFVDIPSMCESKFTRHMLDTIK